MQYSPDGGGLTESGNQLRSLVDDSIELRLRIELGSDGFLLGDRGDMVAADLLTLVLERRKAFEEFVPRSWWNVDFIGTQSIRREVSDGVWARSPDNRPEGTFRGVYFEELVSPTVEGGRWSISREDTGVDASDLSFWLDADALYLIEPRDHGETWRIHFRHLSTNEVHRLAFAPFVDFERDGRQVWSECEILGQEEQLSVEFYDDEGPGGSRRTAAIVLNWMTGEILLPYTVTSDLAFLTKDLVLIARNNLVEDAEMALEVWSLIESRPLWRCKLSLSAGEFSIRFLKRPATNHGRNCPTRYAKLFVPDPTVSILAMVFGTIASGELNHFTVVLSIQPFLRICRSMVESIREEYGHRDTVPVLEWEQWGPSVTRWLPLEIHGNYGSRMVYGARMLAVLMRPREPDGMLACYNMLLDFNPRPLRRGTLTQSEDGVSFITVDYAAAWNAYGRGLESALSYRAWISNLDFRYWNLDLEANTILARMENAYHCYSFLPRMDTEPWLPRLSHMI